MEPIVLFFHAIVCVVLVGLVLLQQGKGASEGMAMGGGASQTIFGSQGSSTFLAKITAAIAAVFFVTSISLAIIAKQKAMSYSEVGMPAEISQDAKSGHDSRLEQIKSDESIPNMEKRVDAPDVPEIK